LSGGDFTIKTEDRETLNDDSGNGVETTREGVDCATDGDDQILKEALIVEIEEEGRELLGSLDYLEPNTWLVVPFVDSESINNGVTSAGHNIS